MQHVRIKLDLHSTADAVWAHHNVNILIAIAILHTTFNGGRTTRVDLILIKKHRTVNFTEQQQQYRAGVSLARQTANRANIILIISEHLLRTRPLQQLIDLTSLIYEI